jgi:hypothetical protein
MVGVSDDDEDRAEKKNGGGLCVMNQEKCGACACIFTLFVVIHAAFFSMIVVPTYFNNIT